MTIEYGKGASFTPRSDTIPQPCKASHSNHFATRYRMGRHRQCDSPAVSETELTSDKPALRDPTTLKAKGNSEINFDTPPNPDSGKWTTIFNGKDLTGWSQKNGTAKYSVQDGTVLGTTDEGSPNSFMCSEKEYANFELTFEVKVDNQLNSGVRFVLEASPKSTMVEFMAHKLKSRHLQAKPAISTAKELHAVGSANNNHKPMQSRTENGTAT